jgi:hypothetical protein
MKGSSKSDSTDVGQWEKGWEEHEQLQLRRLAALPFADKLTWLEQAHRLVMNIGVARSTHTHDPSSPK